MSDKGSSLQVSTVVQGKNIGCKEYLHGKMDKRANYSKQIGGDIFQQTVNARLKEEERGVLYDEFLRALGLNQLLPINSYEVLKTLSEKKEEIIQKYSLRERKEIYLYLNVTGSQSEKGIPVVVDFSEILPTANQKGNGYFDLVCLKAEGSNLVIGGVEVKLAVKPQEYHYDQLIIYLYFLEREIKRFGISGIKVNPLLEIFLPSPESRGKFLTFSTEIYSFERAINVLKEKIERIQKFKIPPISRDCLICKKLNECADNAIAKDAVVAYKTLNGKREDFYYEGCETAPEVDGNYNYLWEELQLISNERGYKKERELVKEKGFWDYRKSPFPEAKRYRHRFRMISHPYKTFLVVYALPSFTDIYDILAFSITLITEEPDRLKKAFSKAVDKNIGLQEVKVAKIAGKEYYTLTVAGFKTEKSVDIDKLFKNLFKDILVEIFNLYKVRPDAKNIFKSEASLFVGFVDEGSREVTRRVFEKFLLGAKSLRAINWIEKIFAGLEMKDKNVMPFYFRGSGAVITNLIISAYMTNEPFLLGYPSLVAIAKKILEEGEEINFDTKNLPYLRIFVGKEIELYSKKFSLFVPPEEIYEIVASRVALVDDILLEEKKLINFQKDCFNQNYFLDYKDFPLSYFPMLTFLSGLIVFSELKKF